MQKDCPAGKEFMLCGAGKSAKELQVNSDRILFPPRADDAVQHA